MPIKSKTSYTAHNNCAMYCKQHEQKQPINHRPLAVAAKCGHLHIKRAKATV